MEQELIVKNLICKEVDQLSINKAWKELNSGTLITNPFKLAP